MADVAVEKSTKSIILASGSPRRRVLLASAGFHVTVVPSGYEEVLPRPMIPREQVMFLALGKALDVADDPALGDALRESVVVSADTLVVHNGEIMGKPKDREDALRMLMELSGNTHEVLTGVCIHDHFRPKTLCFFERTLVTFTAYTPECLEDYLDTPEPYDKAGAYGIQGTFSKYVAGLDGDLNNVIGFPLDRFKKELAGF